MSANAWHLLALFVGIIAGIIGKAMPIGAMAVLAMTIVALLQVTVPEVGANGEPIKNVAAQAAKDAFSSLNSPLIWMIGVAIMISRGLLKTGLGTPRIGYLFLSVFGIEIDATTTTFLGLSLLLLSGVLTWDEVLNEKGAWDTIVWFAALVMMATFLNKLGLIKWFSDLMGNNIQGMGLSWIWGCALLTLVYIYSHYMFASGTAHATAMLGAFYAAGLALGAPPMLFALVLAAATGIMMSLTHYASGSSPVIYGSGYTTMGEWWIAGVVMSVVEIVIFCTIGVLWWKELGYW